MQPFVVLLILFLIGVLVVLPIWAIVKILGHDGDVDVLQRRLSSQEGELAALRSALQSMRSPSVSKAVERPSALVPVATPVAVEPTPVAEPPPICGAAARRQAATGDRRGSFPAVRSRAPSDGFQIYCRG